MKKQLRVNSAQRRFDGRHRRLMFEHCEERLALSGTPVLPVDASPLEGGFISFDSGDYLSTVSNDFLAADSGGSLFSIDRIAIPTLIPTLFKANVGSVAWSLSDPISTSVVGNSTSVMGNFTSVVGGKLKARTDDGVMAAHSDVDVRLFSIDEVILRFAEITEYKGSTGIVANGGSEGILVDVIAEWLGLEPSGASTGTTDAELSMHVGSSVVVVDESLPTTEAVEVLAATKTPRESIAVVDALGEVPADLAHGLSERSVQLVISEDGIRIELPSQEGGNAFTNSAEGGPIEVALAVVETQQAFEAKMFSAVAALLDHENILAQPTPPVAQPFSGELARSVAFETVGLQSPADSAQFDDSQASNADISASRAAVHVDEADTELSRALAFAQWPLVFSATMGAVLVGSRRRSQSRTAQLPPRRNRQPTAL